MSAVRLLSFALLLLFGCPSVPEDVPADDDDDSTVAIDDDDVTEDPTPGDDDDDSSVSDDDDATEPPTPAPTGMEILPCFGGEEGCADEGPFLDETCCAAGDNIEHIGNVNGAEVVDVETDGRWVWACGGFGAAVGDISVSSSPVDSAWVSDRCQRIAVGPLLPDGRRVFYLAHHGDSFVTSAFLGGWTIDATGGVEPIYLEEHPEVLFEGMRVALGHLYVAAHDGGLRVYSLDDEGVPSFVRVVGPFENARKVDVVGDRLYLIDSQDVQVLDISDPGDPQLLQTVDLSGVPRDIDGLDDRVYVALGAQGLVVFQIQVDGTLQFEANWQPSEGSTQAVAATPSHIVLVNWSHVALLDHELRLIGTERVTPTPNFEQDLGIAAHNDLVFAGEWEDLYVLQVRPGYVAPDIEVTEDLIVFAGAEAGSQTIEVGNRGFLDLEVSSADTTAPEAFTVSPSSFTLEPGEATSVTVSFEPPAPAVPLRLQLASNEPDSTQNPLQIPIAASEVGGIGVGDPLTEDWSFLAPGGDLSELDGKVLVLAYFALF